MPSHKKKPADFSALRASIPPNAVALESLSAASPPPNRDFDFFHSIIHRNRVKKYDSFIVAKQDADALWPNYKRKFGSAVSLNTDRGAKNSDAEKAASQNAAIHVMDIGEMMSGPRGRAQGGVSAVLLGKISEELLVFTLKQKVTLLSLEVDYIVSGMLPFSARTVARLLSIRSHGTINVYAIESVLLDGSNTLCSYGIATFVASQEASLLPASAIPYNDPAFGPRDPGPSTSTHSKSYYASSNTPTSIPPFLKPLWTHNGFRPMANLIPGVVPNPMLFESDGFRGGFIWGTQFGTETAREVGPDGPPPQLKPRMEPDLAGLDKRAFTRAWQGVDARAYFAAPEAKRTNYLAGGVTVVKLGKGCGHDEAVSEKVVGCKEKDNKVHTGFLFSLTDHICGDTNARLSPNGGGFTATILFVYPVTPLPAPTPSQPNLGGSSDEYLIIRARVINAEGRRSLTYGSAELMHPDGPHQPSSQVGCKCIGLFVGPKGGGYGGSAWRGVKL